MYKDVVVCRQGRLLSGNAGVKKDKDKCKVSGTAGHCMDAGFKRK